MLQPLHRHTGLGALCGPGLNPILPSRVHSRSIQASASSDGPTSRRSLVKHSLHLLAATGLLSVLDQGNQVCGSQPASLPALLPRPPAAAAGCRLLCRQPAVLHSAAQLLSLLSCTLLHHYPAPTLTAFRPLQLHSRSPQPPPQPPLPLHPHPHRRLRRCCWVAAPLWEPPQLPPSSPTAPQPLLRSKGQRRLCPLLPSRRRTRSRQPSCS